MFEFTRPHHESLQQRAHFFTDPPSFTGSSMGKQLPSRLKEVVYTLSPFETTVMSGLWKDLPGKLHKKVSEVTLASNRCSRKRNHL